MPANQSTPEVTRAVPAVEKYGPLSILPVSPTSEQRDLIRASDLYKLGDARLAWVNEGDLSCLLLEQAYIEMAAEWSAMMTAKGYSGTISEALSMLPDRNTRTPARGGDELREALKPFAAIADEWDRWQAKGSTSTPRMIQLSYGRCTVGLPQYQAARKALASTDMAGAEKLAQDSETLAAQATSTSEAEQLRAYARGIRRGAALSAPPVEGLTSGEGVNPQEYLDFADAMHARLFYPSGATRDDAKPYQIARRLGVGVKTLANAIAASTKATATASVREKARHIETLEYLRTQYLPGGPRDILGALRAGIAALTDSGTAATIGQQDGRK